MGMEIAALVGADPECSLIGAVECKNHPMVDNDYGPCRGKGGTAVKVTDSIVAAGAGRGAVIIDFSSPQSLPVLLPAAAKDGIAVVIGTTGLSDNDRSFIESFVTKIPVVVSPNMSLGVNLLFYLTGIVASRLKDNYDIEIIEAHHRFKKDAPSGTAKRLGEIAAEALGCSYESCVRDGRSGISEQKERSHKEIGMHAVRGGDIVGEHTVMFAGLGERVELKHVAQSRSTLARGAVVAAKWVADKKPGLYSMSDVLGF